MMMMMMMMMMIMMSLLSNYLLWSVCEEHLSDISHPDSFQAVELGNTVSITCHISNTGRQRVWYKLTTGRNLQRVATTDTFYNLTVFKKQNHRYVVESERFSSHLSITSTTREDAGTYYCGVMNLYEIQFGSGTILIIKGTKMITNSVVQQPEYESVHSGDSVTLSCSVHIDHCAAEHTSITWMKNSDHSAPEMIHSSGYKNNTCHMTKPGSEETTCVYNLLMRNLGSDDAGTYYCAVTSCGHILFGNGTKINIHSKSKRDVDFIKSPHLTPTVIALVLSNIVFGVVTFLLVWMLYKNNKKDQTASRSNDASPGSYQTDVTYAAVCAAPRSSSCRPAPVKHSTDPTVYSHISH